MFKRPTKKIYRAKLDNNRSIIVGWTRFKQKPTKNSFWYTVKTLLF